MNATIDLITNTIGQKEGEIQGATTDTSSSNMGMGETDAPAANTANAENDTAEDTTAATPPETVTTAPTSSASIGASVGVRGVNNPDDVTIVQTLLNEIYVKFGH